MSYFCIRSSIQNLIISLLNNESHSCGPLWLLTKQLHLITFSFFCVLYRTEPSRFFPSPLRSESQTSQKVKYFPKSHEFLSLRREGEGRRRKGGIGRIFLTRHQNLLNLNIIDNVWHYIFFFVLGLFNQLHIYVKNVITERGHNKDHTVRIPRVTLLFEKDDGCGTRECLFLEPFRLEPSTDETCVASVYWINFRHRLRKVVTMV